MLVVSANQSINESARTADDDDVSEEKSLTF